MDKIQAFHQFWSSFGLPAYDAGSIPTDAEFPYITYEVAISDFGNQIPFTAGVWYKGTSWVGATQKVDEIAQKIGRGGILIPYEGGALWITKASAFAQRMTDENDLIKRYVIQCAIEYME